MLNGPAQHEGKVQGSSVLSSNSRSSVFTALLNSSFSEEGLINRITARSLQVAIAARFQGLVAHQPGPGQEVARVDRFSK